MDYYPPPVWVDNTPDRLTEICVRYCASHPNTYSEVEYSTSQRQLREYLPREICERLLHARLPGNPSIDDTVLHTFCQVADNIYPPPHLRKINLRDSNVTDSGLTKLLQMHQVTDLNIDKCKKLTCASLAAINLYDRHLKTLHIGNSRILPSKPPHSSNAHLKGLPIFPGAILQTPELRILVLREHCPEVEKYYDSLLLPLRQLTYLDLSGCQCLGDMAYLLHMKSLNGLVLYNVIIPQSAIFNICHLKQLRKLDISQSEDGHGEFEEPNKVLESLVINLPFLEYLDISGTNLDGRGKMETPASRKKGKILEPLTDIAGLQSRVSSPLKFLGLYSTAHGSCRSHHIPAEQVTGDANEEQILLAAEMYLDRPGTLIKVLNDLFHLLRFDICVDSKRATEVIIKAMELHVDHKHIQISGSASLFYIVKGGEKMQFNVKVKQRILHTLLVSMMEHKGDATMMRNGCLTLCHFRIPDDLLFEYERVIHVLLHVVTDEDREEEFVQRVGVFLLNSMACRLEGKHKQLLGDLGAISTMMNLIQLRLDRKRCDEVMEMAWSTMWNITDETPINCQRFLELQGMQYFIHCLHAFPTKESLLRNMMGLLGNVAEVKELRPHLMKQDYVRVFSELLDSESEGIEVSYNAAGVLAHMASDGEEFWKIENPRRGEILRHLVDAVNRWDLKKQRNINYRSFEPFFRLIKCEDTPEAQYWAVWAMANLTSVYPNKYCKLVDTENGLELLEKIRQAENKNSRIHELAQIVLDNCALQKSDNSSGEDYDSS